jgi:hypothetical protein
VYNGVEMVRHEHKRIVAQRRESCRKVLPDGLYAAAEIVQDAVLVRDHAEDRLVLCDLRRDEEPAFGIVDI